LAWGQFTWLSAGPHPAQKAARCFPRFPASVWNISYGADEMKIVDYETNKILSDVAIFLTKEEAASLLVYLKRLVEKPDVQKVYLSEIVMDHIERELVVALNTA
jgi:hypothetical protein